MPLGYFDSSAYLKLLIAESGSDLARELWNSCEVAVSSRLAYPEVRAALAAAGRAGRLSRDRQRRAEERWEQFWAATRPIELTTSVAAHAGDLAGRHDLRGADAVHLSSLLALGTDKTLFVAWDERLRAGARAAGAQVAPA